MAPMSSLTSVSAVRRSWWQGVAKQQTAEHSNATRRSCRVMQHVVEQQCENIDTSANKMTANIPVESNGKRSNHSARSRVQPHRLLHLLSQMPPCRGTPHGPYVMSHKRLNPTRDLVAQFPLRQAYEVTLVVNSQTARGLVINVSGKSRAIAETSAATQAEPNKRQLGPNPLQHEMWRNTRTHRHINQEPKFPDRLPKPKLESWCT